jgi:hypothetical protein
VPHDTCCVYVDASLSVMQFEEIVVASVLRARYEFRVGFVEVAAGFAGECVACLLRLLHRLRAPSLQQLDFQLLRLRTRVVGDDEPVGTVDRPAPVSAMRVTTAPEDSSGSGSVSSSSSSSSSSDTESDGSAGSESDDVPRQMLQLHVRRLVGRFRHVRRANEMQALR